MRKTLLLSNYYEAISFIPLRKLVKLIAKEKVLIEASWDDENLMWASGKIKYPSTVRLKHSINRMPRRVRWNRKGVFRRDMYTCQYCARLVNPAKLTIDHVLPRAQGGVTSWDNCVACCLPCNAKKDNRTPEQAHMKLLNKPGPPTRALVTEYILTKPKHDSWDVFFKEEAERAKPHNHI